GEPREGHEPSPFLQLHLLRFGRSASAPRPPTVSPSSFGRAPCAFYCKLCAARHTREQNSLPAQHSHVSVFPESGSKPAPQAAQVLTWSLRVSSLSCFIGPPG